jgi:methionyl-tRNA synthetase
MTKAQRKILVTTALPYANGSLHLGHVIEAVQADIWVRFQRLCGHACHFVSADDTHGTPVMLRAEQEGKTPEQLIAEVHRDHAADLKAFHIDFDNFHTTHAPENRDLTYDTYRRLQAAGKIKSKVIEQLYDPVRNMFLPDRFVKGQCPKCAAKDQYGDNCEVCGATYVPSELIAPYSVVSGAAPVMKPSEHYFFGLSECAPFLSDWVHGCNAVDGGPRLQAAAANKMKEWLGGGLKDWDISRDAPYFGFEIPGTVGKYFYVWLDAPIGYMASFKHFADAAGIDFDEYWAADSTTELYHFIGKDILYFHALFWPATLHAAGFRLPNAVFTHGFLTVNGQKMSKSRGTFITARQYLDHFDPEHLRYYFATKLNGNIEDIDLNYGDLASRVNSDLIGKYINIASRSFGFIGKYFDGQLGAPGAGDRQWLDKVRFGDSWDGADAPARADRVIADLYARREYSKAMREIFQLVDIANFFINQEKPWELAKLPQSRARLHEVCSTAVNMFRVLTIYLKPVLPALARNVEALLQIEALLWRDAQTDMAAGHGIGEFRRLMERVDLKEAQPPAVPAAA